MSFDDLIGRSWDENRLVSVLIELTYRCNLHCVFCYNDLSLRGRQMRFDDYAVLLEDLAAMSVLNVSLSGGEPLAHPDFFRVGARARELGFVVRVKSNGHTLNAEVARRLRDEVDPFVVETSLHGATAETHERQTRVEGSFTRLVTNIRHMTDAGLRVKVNSTLTAWNQDETRAMYALCDELGVPLTFDLVVTPRDDGDRSPLALAASADGVRELLRVQTERYEAQAAASSAPAPAPSSAAPPQKHCGAGSSGIAVDPYGNVYPCVAWRRAAGNLHDTRIIDLWKSSFDGVRRQTVDAAGVARAHPLAQTLNFCPGLAVTLTGSPVTVPEETERIARVVAQAT